MLQTLGAAGSSWGQTIPLQRTIYGNTYCKVTKPPQCLVKIQISGLPLLSIESRCTHREEAQLGQLGSLKQTKRPHSNPNWFTTLLRLSFFSTCKDTAHESQMSVSKFPWWRVHTQVCEAEARGSEYVSWRKLSLWAKKLPALCFCSGIFPWLQARGAAGKKPPPYGSEPLTLLLRRIFKPDVVLLTPAYIHHIMLFSFVFQQIHYVFFDFSISWPEHIPLTNSNFLLTKL